MLPPVTHPHPYPLPCLRRSGFAQAGIKGEGEKSMASIFFRKFEGFTETIEISPQSRRGHREATFLQSPSAIFATPR